MNNKPPNKQPPTLQCPHCGAQTEVLKSNDWFPCSRCGIMVQLQKGKDNYYFLKKKSPLIIKPMSLDKVLKYKVLLDREAEQFRLKKQKIGEQINIQIRKNQNTTELRNELNRLEIDTDELRSTLEQLDSMEIILREERRDAIRASDNSGGVFLGAVILISIDLILVSLITSTGWKIAGAIGAIFLSASILSAMATPGKA